MGLYMHHKCGDVLLITGKGPQLQFPHLNHVWSSSANLAMYVDIVYSDENLLLNIHRQTWFQDTVIALKTVVTGVENLL